MHAYPVCFTFNYIYIAQRFFIVSLQNLTCNPPFLIASINFSQSILFAMNFYFLIGYQQSGQKEISIKVKYILTKRFINLTTDIVAVVIVLLDGKDIKNNWNPQSFVLINILQVNHLFYYYKVSFEMSSSPILFLFLFAR